MPILRSPTLLVVTENPSILFWVKKNLTGQFFILDAAKKIDVLRIIQYSSLDLILIDANLEEGPALELCKKIRKNLHTNLTPILLITGRLKKSYRDKALDAGVNDFLNNELDIEELETRIAVAKKALGLREKTAELSSSLLSQMGEFPKKYFKNKRIVHDQMLQLLATAEIEKIPLVLLVLRIDPFSETPIDEEILGKVTEVITRELREQDFLMPSSDTQFIILLGDTRIEEAQTMGEHLKKEIRRTSFTIRGEPLPLTASIALSSIETTENDFTQKLGSLKASLRQNTQTNQIICPDQESL